ncbi:MAG: type II toxin-antitoxin system HicA family toxin [Bacteroidota bacterium]
MNQPMLKAGDVLTALKKYGFTVVRQKGSHIRLRHEDGRCTTLPYHSGQDIGKGLLRKILRDTELSIDDLQKK